MKAAWVTGLLVAMQIHATPLATPVRAPRLATRAHAMSQAIALHAAARASETSLARVVAIDDGERIPRDIRVPLPASPWPRVVELDALRDETVAFQLVVEAQDDTLEDLTATLGAFAREDGVRLRIDVEAWAESFIEIQRPSFNVHHPGALPFAEHAAPDVSRTLGWWSDALVPGAARAEPGSRAAMWVDLYVHADAEPGIYRSAVHVQSRRGLVATKPLTLSVHRAQLPYASRTVFAYYDPDTLERRMGSRAAEPGLRRMLHAHHLTGVREIDSEEDAAKELDYLDGRAFSAAQGYRGPGRDEGERVFIIGAYGGLGEPNQAAAERAAAIAARVRPALKPRASMFLYAIDETCESPWPFVWQSLKKDNASLADVAIGATCNRDPLVQNSDFVLTPTWTYRSARARIGAAQGKRVWAYNGRRPAAGAMTIDVPATDLRVTGWIMERYDVEAWFYWEVIYWMDPRARGGQGGSTGFDPYVVTETFHNDEGDTANHDGLLLYPGRQLAPNMTDHGVDAVFPSIRLKNLRRGIQDAALIALAREVDGERTRDLVRRMVPVALAAATRRVSWPERGLAWLEARAELVAIIDAHPQPSTNVGSLTASRGCALAQSKCDSLPLFAGFFSWFCLAVGRRRRTMKDARSCSCRLEPDPVPSRPTRNARCIRRPTK